MSRTLFERHARGNAVPESTVAQGKPPMGLTEDEAMFYRYLLKQAKGRLEQEYLPAHVVEKALVDWLELGLGLFSFQVDG